MKDRFEKMKAWIKTQDPKALAMIVFGTVVATGASLALYKEQSKEKNRYLPSPCYDDDEMIHMRELELAEVKAFVAEEEAELEALKNQ